jgi:hypothetical protein
MADAAAASELDFLVGPDLGGLIVGRNYRDFTALKVNATNLNARRL